MRLLSCLVLIINLIACTSTKEATTSFRDGFDFSAVETYSTYGRNSAFGELQNINDSTRNTIELAIEQGFDENGFRYNNVKNADIMIAYHVINHNLVEFDKYNKQVKYCGYCLNGNDTTRLDLEKKQRPGSLVLDIIDPTSQRSVWRSVYPLGFKDKDNSREMQEKISHAVDQMLKDYPRVKKTAAMITLQKEFA